MNTTVRPLNDVRRTLDIDLVADFTCPWSWLGMAQLTRALGNLSGDVETRLRWHPFRMAAPAENAAPRSFPRVPRRTSAVGHQRAVRGEEPDRGRPRARHRFPLREARCVAEHFGGASAGAARRQRRPARERGRGDLPRLFRARCRHRRRRTCWRGSARRRASSRQDACRPSAKPATARACWRAARSACAASACAPCRTCCSAAACSCRAP